MAIELTTRAYTLKLSGDDNWRHALWKTHATVNRGVRVWGDWLLTLRGGLPASLADDRSILPITDKDVAAEMKRRKRKGDAARNEIRQLLERQRLDGLRVVLALSWLSVETPKSLAPEDHIVACGSEPTEVRCRKVTAAFEQILDRLKIANRDEWIAACEPALTARIRTDAVWVDRSAAFAQLAKQCSGLSADWATETLFSLLGDAKDYFTIPEADAAPTTEGKDFVIKAGNWLSAHWGAGEKSDAGAIAEKLTKLAAVEVADMQETPGPQAIAALLATLSAETGKETDPDKLFKKLKQAVGWKGRPSKGAMALQKLLSADNVTEELWDQVAAKLSEESAVQEKKAGGSTEIPAWMPNFRSCIENAIGMPFRVQRDNIWEFAVMLDHDLRRASAGHTWIKRAEAKRRQFQEDAGKIDHVPPAACAWLDRYTESRSTDTGAVDGYLIRKRAIEGWEKIVNRWKSVDRMSEADQKELAADVPIEAPDGRTRPLAERARISAARELQADPEIDKFGDIQLFEALAADEAICIWRNEKGKPDATILKDYVAARVAENDRRRFKVPAYRHPDPLRHPVFVDFGKSRWSIEYSALKTVRVREKTRKKLDKAKSDKTREKYAQQLAEKPDLHGVTLSLWTGDVVEPQLLRWHGKRLRKDLDFDHFEKDGATVSRADRLGRSIAGEPRAAVNIAQVFDQEEWNGRLQAPRAELDRLADLIYGKNGESDGGEFDIGALDRKARRQWERLNWFLSCSAKLQPAGPWLDDYVLPDGWHYRFNNKKKEHYLDIEANTGRKGRARLTLSRLPGLRVLSVDLGERHAAACAVWHTLSDTEFKKEIANGRIVAGGTGPQYLYVHVERTGDDGKSRKTIYRRIAADECDGNPHPAPWARLDRQFLIKLQGEDRKARHARADEFALFKDLCDSLGKQIEDPHEELDLNGATTLYPRIDELMRNAVNVARLGLRRHGNCARIAFALTSKQKPISGGRTVEMDDEQRIKAMQDALVLWQELAGSRDYADPWAKQLWDDWVVGKFGGSQPVELDETDTGSERKKKLNESREPLKPIAEQLLTRDNTDLHNLWADEWESRKQKFQTLLRRLRKLILPRVGKRPAGDSPDFAGWKEKAKQLRQVGGLSYTRLASIRGLYQLMRAFHMRPEPTDLRAGIKRIEEEAEAGNRFGLRILQTLDRLRENRVKQLASRLVEAALGVGSENRKIHWERGRKRPGGRIDETHDDARFAPCHAIVIENLERYRPDEKRTRRENRGLMNWAARNVRKCLIEGCQLHGLYFDEIDPRYTSRQDSRTALPGMRCRDAALDDFVKPGGFWQGTVAAAKKRLDKGGTDSRDQLLVDLSTRWGAADEQTRRQARPIRIPHKDGPVFVAADAASKPAAALHADLNAAANIGLRALVDPDWEGSWWYLPVKAADGKLVSEKLTGCAVIDPDNSFLSQSDSEKKEIVNVWRDPSASELSQAAWMQYTPYWNAVQQRVVQGLCRTNGLDESP